MQEFTTPEPTGLGRACSRREGRVEHVDINGDVERAVADSTADLLDDPVDPGADEFARSDALETHGVINLVAFRPVDGAANTDVHAALRIEKSIFEGSTGGRPVVRVRAEVGSPGIEVGIEVHDGDGAVESVQVLTHRLDLE